MFRDVLGIHWHYGTFLFSHKVLKGTDISYMPSATVNIPHIGGVQPRFGQVYDDVYLPLWHFIELFHHCTKIPVLCLSALTLSFTPGRPRSFYVHTFSFPRVSWS